VQNASFAGRALKKICGKDYGEDFAAWRAWWDNGPKSPTGAHDWVEDRTATVGSGRGDSGVATRRGGGAARDAGLERPA